MAKPNNRTPGFNVYLGTQTEKEQAMASLTEIANALDIDSAGQMIRWLASQDPTAIIEALRPLRAKEFDEKASKFK